MARRNKKHDGHGGPNHERWLITYADLITLLLIFFVIMYAMSKVDIQKYKVLSQTLHNQFQKADSVVQMSPDGLSGDLNPGNYPSTDTPVTASASPSPTPEPTPSSDPGKEKLEKELQDLLTKVNHYINENHLQAQASASDTKRGVVIKLNDVILFDLGKADLKEKSLPILDKLSSLFLSLNTKVSVEGHTDNLPVAGGSPFKDNWGLSQARSVAVVRYFTKTAGLKDNMFVATAYADTIPVVPNDSDEDRAKNRRVELVVLREPLVAGGN